MRILDARIFSKSFGGKIEILKKGWHRKLKKKKNGPCLFCAPVFSSLFGRVNLGSQDNF